ncbi:hypothetical protein [Kribbella sp. C-35]|uniref:hypothetical protein n=1 Tax=Kribbella sp. C-35 TaxID=2789276 RepID=UPI00397DEB8B
MILSETVASALMVAATERRAGGELRTGLVLDALSRVDTLGDWSRIWLHSGTPAAIGLSDVADDAESQDAVTFRSRSTWRGVPLSAAMKACMDLLAELVDTYHMVPVQPGALALALVAVPSGGAAQALLTSGETTRDELINIIQSDLLGTSLSGLPSVLAGAGEGAALVNELPLHRATAQAHPRSPDDIDLLLASASAPEVEKVLARANVDSELIGLIAELARAFGSRPAAEAVSTVEERSDRRPATDLDVFVEVAGRPSAALERALGIFGVSGAELAVDARLEAYADDRVARSRAERLSSVINLVAMTAVFGLLIWHAVGPGAWWELFLIPLVFTGPPSSPSIISLVSAVVFWLLAGPLVGGAKLVETAISYWRSRAERRDLLSRTGIWLTETEHNALEKRRRGRGEAILATKTASLLSWRLRRLERAAAKAAARHTSSADVP